MTIFPPRPQTFACAICTKTCDYDSAIPWHYRSADEYDIPPVCRRCEITWGKGLGGWGDKNRDRRIIRQIGALAAAIEVEAYRLQHRKGPLYAKG